MPPRPPTKKQIDAGVRYLDEVKHCQELMLPNMLSNDQAMRATPPCNWTFQQIDDAKWTSFYVNCFPQHLRR